MAVKKIITLLSLGALLAGLFGCGSGNDEKAPESASAGAPNGAPANATPDQPDPSKGERGAGDMPGNGPTTK